MNAKRLALSTAGAVAASISGYALADIVVTFDTGLVTGLGTIEPQNNLSGTLTGMDIAVNFYNSASSGVWASDLLIAVTGVNNDPNQGIEWGGFNASYGFQDGGSFSWSAAYGNYSASFNVAPGLSVQNGTLQVANGWTTSPGGAWSGTVTLYGLTAGGEGGGGGPAAIPEPGSFAIATGLVMATVAKRFRSWRTKRASSPTNIQPSSCT